MIKNLRLVVSKAAEGDGGPAQPCMLPDASRVVRYEPCLCFGGSMKLSSCRRWRFLAHSPHSFFSGQWSVLVPGSTNRRMDCTLSNLSATRRAPNYCRHSSSSEGGFKLRIRTEGLRRENGRWERQRRLCHPLRQGVDSTPPAHAKDDHVQPAARSPSILGATLDSLHRLLAFWYDTVINRGKRGVG